MNLLHSHPGQRLSKLQDEINHFFRHGDWFPTHTDESGTTSTSQWMPSVDIKDEENQFVIRADIPGVDPKDIDVSMDNGILTIKGERKTEEKEESKDYCRVECSYGSFYRRFSLPDTANSEEIKATGKDGVLEITVAKREATKAKKIPIQT